MSVRTAADTEDSLRLEQFEKFGEYAAAGRLATQKALVEAQRSMAAGRIPIAGAVVIREEDGRLTAVATGHNGRIPGADDEASGPNGYPTDHGETGCLRSVTDFKSVDWKRAVFATTLSPCVMCTRSILHLHALGLSRVVIAESKSFPGRKDLLHAVKNPTMQIVELTNDVAIRDMGLFARKYPWDWAADIGQIPQSHSAAELGRVLFEDDEHGPTPAFKKLFDPVCDELDAFEAGAEVAAVAAVVMLESGKVLALAADKRSASGGNPVLSGKNSMFILSSDCQSRKWLKR